jgi:hypothetical protein
VPARIWKILVYFKILKWLSGAMTEKIIKSISNAVAHRKTEISSPLPSKCRIANNYNASQGGKV